MLLLSYFQVWSDPFCMFLLQVSLKLVLILIVISLLSPPLPLPFLPLTSSHHPGLICLFPFPVPFNFPWLHRFIHIFYYIQFLTIPFICILSSHINLYILSFLIMCSVRSRVEGRSASWSRTRNNQKMSTWTTYEIFNITASFCY